MPVPRSWLAVLVTVEAAVADFVVLVVSFAAMASPEFTAAWTLGIDDNVSPCAVVAASTAAVAVWRSEIVCRRAAIKRSAVPADWVALLVADSSPGRAPRAPTQL